MADLDWENVTSWETSQREQQQRDTVRDAPGGPIHFDNPSDDLFARLFVNDSPDACIPWKYCDLILSAFKDIRFNSREVTFKDCGDMFCRMGEVRDDAWSAIEARSVANTTIPRAVLEGVFDVIKVEMLSLADIRRQASRNRSFDPGRAYGELTTPREWKDTL